jgi:hypothetical protein
VVNALLAQQAVVAALPAAQQPAALLVLRQAAKSFATRAEAHRRVVSRVSTLPLLLYSGG